MVGPVKIFINIVIIKQAQWFWSSLETTSLEDTLIKLGMVKILLISACNSHNLHAFYIGASPYGKLLLIVIHSHRLMTLTYVSFL